MTRKRLWIVLATLAIVAAVMVGRSFRRPDVGPWRSRYEVATESCPRGANADPCVEVRWLGVATLVFDDGKTQLLTDGFFSRPGLTDLVSGRPVSSDLAAIEAGLQRAGVDRAAAVMTVHSHYDHAMDAPEVARRTGAILLGSASTAMIGRGAGLESSRIVEVEIGRPYGFGDFEVLFHRSKHILLPAGQGRLGAALDAPLIQPVPIDAYVEGGSFSIEIRHPSGVALVQGSAGYIEGELAGVDADVVLLGVGGLARESAAYREAYYRELIDRVGARRVVPIHWDDFTLAPGVVEAFPLIFGNVEETFAELAERAATNPGLSLSLLPPWQPTVLFAN